VTPASRLSLRWLSPALVVWRDISNDPGYAATQSP